MARPNKIWFRKDTGWWMVTLGGQKVKLVQGRENKKPAEDKFHEFAVVRIHAPEKSSARAADVIEAFLAWADTRLTDETLRNYTWYGQIFFSKHSGIFLLWNFVPFT